MKHTVQRSKDNHISSEKHNDEMWYVPLVCSYLTLLSISSYKNVQLQTKPPD